MEGSGAPRIVEEPVWYQPLGNPDWLLPPLRDDAQTILFAPMASPTGGPGLAGSLTAALPLALAEAIRFSTDCRAVATSVFGVDVGARVTVRTAVVGEGDERVLRLRAEDSSGATVLERTSPAPDDEALARALAGLPADVLPVLRDARIRSVWSTVYAPPSPERAIDQTRAYRACQWLQEPGTYDETDIDGDEVATLRDRVRAALHLLAGQASRGGGPLDVARFLAGLSGSRAADSPVFLEFRLPANAIAMAVEDPQDPVYALSVLALSLFEDVSAARRRAAELTSTASPELRRWLARAAARG
jgi:hypothetical protein